MKKIILILLLIILAVTLNAQSKSTGKAMFLSAVFPGAGQMYLGNKAKAGTYAGIESLIILSYLRLNKEVDWKTHSYKLYANQYAGVPMSASENYYRFIGTYTNSDSYNANVERYYRNRYIVYEHNPDLYNQALELYLVTGEDEWDWLSKDHWIRYREMRQEKQRMEIYVNFAVGAAVLNRLISVVDTALIARSIKKSNVEVGDNHTSFLSNINIEPDFSRNGLVITYEQRF